MYNIRALMNKHTQVYYLSRTWKRPEHFLLFKWPFDDLKTHSDWLSKQILGIMEKIKWSIGSFLLSHRSVCLKAVLTLREYVYYALFIC